MLFLVSFVDVLFLYGQPVPLLLAGLVVPDGRLHVDGVELLLLIERCQRTHPVVLLHAGDLHLQNEMI